MINSWIKRWYIALIVTEFRGNTITISDPKEKISKFSQISLKLFSLFHRISPLPLLCSWIVHHLQVLLNICWRSIVEEAWRIGTVGTLLIHGIFEFLHHRALLRCILDFIHLLHHHRRSVFIIQALKQAESRSASSRGKNPSSSILAISLWLW